MPTWSQTIPPNNMRSSSRLKDALKAAMLSVQIKMKQMGTALPNLDSTVTLKMFISLGRRDQNGKRTMS